MSNTVLLTGATGLLGNAIARLLVAEGRHVRALVRDPSRATNVVPSACELVAGDVTDAASVLEAAKGCGVVYHASGLPSPFSLGSTDLHGATPATGTLQMGEVAEHCLRREPFRNDSKI